MVEKWDIEDYKARKGTEKTISALMDMKAKTEDIVLDMEDRILPGSEKLSDIMHAGAVMTLGKPGLVKEIWGIVSKYNNDIKERFK